MPTPLTTLRLDPALRAAVDKAAAKAGVSVSDFIRTAISRELAAAPKPQGSKPR